MRLMVTGSREVESSAQVVLFVELDKYLTRFGAYLEILHGGAKGVDAMANQWARDRKVVVRCFLPDPRQPSYKAALHMRNDQMLCACEEVLAVWDGSSPGTSSVIQKARRDGKPIQVFKWSPHYRLFLLEDEQQSLF